MTGRDAIVNERLHPSWKLYRVTYRSGKVIRIWAPSSASASYQAMSRGDVLDPRGPEIRTTQDVTP